MQELRCPNCNNIINFINFMKAPTPWHLSCDFCRARIKFQKYSFEILILAIIGGIALGLATIVSFLYFGYYYPVFVFIIGIIVIEFIIFQVVKVLEVPLIMRP